MKIKSEFGDTLFNHFPKEVENKYQLISKFPAMCKELNSCDTLLVVSLSNDEVEKIKSEFSSIKLDNNLLFTVNELNKTNNSFTKDEILRINLIPDINKLISNCITCSDIGKINWDNLEIHQINTQSGIFISKEFLSEDLKIQSYWKHGVSRGYALDEVGFNVIYWLEIW